MTAIEAIDRELARINEILSKTMILGDLGYNLLSQRAWLQTELVKIAQREIKDK